VIDSDGWMHSGDMGLIRPDGHLRFMGRYKDMLKIGGENVDPLEVETYLIKHPGINAVAVVGFPDARLSEVAVAFVRLESGQFPMTGSGKVQKVKLREEARRRLKEGALTLNVSSCCAPNSNRDQS
jgi:fatty-acyl-CoA synthase